MLKSRMMMTRSPVPPSSGVLSHPKYTPITMAMKIHKTIRNCPCFRR